LIAPTAALSAPHTHHPQFPAPVTLSRSEGSSCIGDAMLHYAQYETWARLPLPAPVTLNRSEGSSCMGREHRSSWSIGCSIYYVGVKICSYILDAYLDQIMSQAETTDREDS
jgi:hypothetical protein